MGLQKRILFIVSNLLLCALIYAQADWTVTLNGKVSEDDKPLGRVILSLKKNGVDEEKLFTAPNGKFSLVLESDNEYELYFTKKGYVTKFIAYNTKNVPEDKVSGLYAEFIFELDLFKEMEGLNTSILEFPVFRVKYYPGVKNLEYDKKHENKVRSRLNLLLKEYKEAKEREEKLALDAAAAEEKNRVDKGYNDQIELASTLLQSKKYEEAQEAYEKAMEIKPKATFPRDKIVAIEKLIKERDKTKVLSKDMEARYITIIESADAAFKNGKFASAKSLYKRASIIASDRPYPKDQIALAKEELLAAKEKVPFQNVTDEKYDLIIARADNEFMGEDYVRARASYIAASRVKPAATYPKDRINEIASIVAANRQEAADAKPASKQKVKTKVKKGDKKRAPQQKPEEEDIGSYLIALAQEYDEGITEEIEVAGGKKITRIIVVKDGKANEYKKEVYSWATYYKKNNKTIPRYVFENETKQ